MLVKTTGCGIQTKGEGWAKIASRVLRSNLKTAILQFGLGFWGDQLPGVDVKPKSFPPQAPHTAW